MQKVGIVGCGDIGRRVAKVYQFIYQNATSQTSDAVLFGIARSQQSVDLGEQQGILMQQIDMDMQVVQAHDFQDCDVFYFAPPPSDTDNDTRLKRFLQTVQARPNKIVLISTTGVYGDSQGGWIDENFPLNPVAERAKRRVSAETLLRDWAAKYQKPFVILRVPGIYAKDRLPIARLQKGLPVVKADEAPWTNRIHADDLAYICVTAMQTDTPSDLYNVTDGHPSTMTAYFNQVADAVGLARPPQISMEEAEQTLSAGMVSYLRESRRISNRKMLDELSVTLKYPDLAAGLR